MGLIKKISLNYTSYILNNISGNTTKSYIENIFLFVGKYPSFFVTTPSLFYKTKFLETNYLKNEAIIFK